MSDHNKTLKEELNVLIQALETMQKEAKQDGIVTKEEQKDIDTLMLEITLAKEQITSLKNDHFPDQEIAINQNKKQDPTKTPEPVKFLVNGELPNSEEQHELTIINTDLYEKEEVSVKQWLEAHLQDGMNVEEVVNQLKQEVKITMMADELIKEFILKIATKEGIQFQKLPMPEAETGNFTTLIFRSKNFNLDLNIYSDLRLQFPAEWQTGKIVIDLTASYEKEFGLSIKVNDSDYFNLKLKAQYSFGEIKNKALKEQGLSENDQQQLDPNLTQHKAKISLSHDSTVKVYNAKPSDAIQKVLIKKGESLEKALKEYDKAVEGLDKTLALKDVISAVKGMYSLIEELKAGAKEVPLYSIEVQSKITSAGNDIEHSHMLMLTVNF